MCCGEKRSALRRSAPVARSVPQNTSFRAAGLGVRNGAGEEAPAQAISRAASAPRGVQKPIIQTPSTATGNRSTIEIRYLGTSLIRIQGPVTGWFYEFSGPHPVLTVDRRDAPSLLCGRLFNRA
jgi:hypothetical protein